MLHIIGVAHHAQSQTRGEDRTECQAKFAKTLHAAISRVHPILIAEEDSEEALCCRNGESIARQIAGEHVIEHRFCDPTQEQRKAIDYSDDSFSFIQKFSKEREELSADKLEEIYVRERATHIARYLAKRERFWLNHLADHLNDQIIFICGDFHVETFGDLLQGAGVPFEMIDRGIGLTQSDRRFDRRVREFLAQHPDLGR